jgi:hypothetical protein
MRFGDLLDPERALTMFTKLAVGLVLLSIFMQLLVCLVRQISLMTALGIFCVFSLLSPVAHLVRRSRQGGLQRHARRGAERTPLLPQQEEAE